MFAALLMDKPSALPPAATARASAPPRRRFEAEARELAPLVRAVIAAVLREGVHHPDVEDATNETLRRALESESTVHGPIRPWVLGIARHVALDVHRARKRRRTREVEEPHTEEPASVRFVEGLADPGARQDDEFARKQQLEKIVSLLDTLPEGQRNALVLFHAEGLGYQEIAARLGVPLGTVATWVTRARRALAEALEDEVLGAKDPRKGRKP